MKAIYDKLYDIFRDMWISPTISGFLRDNTIKPKRFNELLGKYYDGYPDEYDLEEKHIGL